MPLLLLRATYCGSSALLCSAVHATIWTTATYTYLHLPPCLPHTCCLLFTTAFLVTASLPSMPLYLHSPRLLAGGIFAFRTYTLWRCLLPAYHLHLLLYILLPICLYTLPAFFTPGLHYCPRFSTTLLLVMRFYLPLPFGSLGWMLFDGTPVNGGGWFCLPAHHFGRLGGGFAGTWHACVTRAWLLLDSWAAQDGRERRPCATSYAYTDARTVPTHHAALSAHLFL